MTAKKTKRPARSPFRGATRADLAMLRGLAVAVRDWERSLAAGTFYWLPPSSTILHNSPGVKQALTRERFQDKAWARLRALPQWPEIDTVYTLAHLERYDPQAHQVRMLREELAAHKLECKGPSA
jgi:hypothetical protein